MPRAGVLLSLSLLGVTSCGSTATLARLDGPDNEATIAGSSAQAIYVRSDSGQVYRLDRASVSDIDHPGNVTGSVGLAMLPACVLAVDSAPKDRSNVSAAVALFCAPGLLLATVGWYQFFRSHIAAGSTRPEPPPPPIAPAPNFLPPLPPDAGQSDDAGTGSPSDSASDGSS